MIRLKAKIYRIAMVRWVDVARKAVAELGAAKELNARLYFNNDIDRVTLLPGKRGFYRLAIKVELLRHAGVDAGDTIEFELKPDKESREPDLPDEMRRVFQLRPHLLQRWQDHSLALRRQVVRYIEQAVSPDTRAKRCWIFIDRLEESGRLGQN